MFDRLLACVIRLAALGVALGWLLSVMSCLDARGYLWLGLPGVLIVILSVWKIPAAQKQVSFFPHLARWRRRRRALPLIFLFTFLLVLCGSILHEPNNFDGLSYRIPRVLYWTSEHHWLWINTAFGPANYTLPNYEWLTVPVFLATGGFHLTVIINWISFLFLPPLFFSLLRAFGTPRRLAWDWMWLFPSGYMIALQAGGIGNDLAGLTALLAALHCANRFVATDRKSFMLDALLAAAFCTGVKLTNLPLAVFVLIILLRKSGQLLAQHRLFTVATLIAATWVSAFIPLLLNVKHSGTLLGTASSRDELHNPIAGLIGNVLITAEQALAPPVLPGAAHVSTLMENSLGHRFGGWLQTAYPKFSLRLNELPQEDFGGLGLAVTLALFVNCFLAIKRRKRGSQPPSASPLLAWQKIVWTGWLIFAGLIVATKLGTGDAFCRNLLPWFPCALAPVIARFGSERVCRSHAWRRLIPLVSLSVLPALLLLPSRPLVPPSALAALAQRAGASDATLDRLQRVYSAYANRADIFAGVKKYLPPNVNPLALVSDGSEPTASWWQPYGTRRCLYLFNDADVTAARSAGVQFVVLKAGFCEKYFQTDTPGWLQTHHAHAIETVEVRALAATPPVDYTVAQFDSDAR